MGHLLKSAHTTYIASGAQARLHVALLVGDASFLGLFLGVVLGTVAGVEERETITPWVVALFFLTMLTMLVQVVFALFRASSIARSRDTYLFNDFQIFYEVWIAFVRKPTFEQAADQLRWPATRRRWYLGSLIGVFLCVSTVMAIWALP